MSSLSTMAGAVAQAPHAAPPHAAAPPSGVPAAPAPAAPAAPTDGSQPAQHSGVTVADLPHLAVAAPGAAPTDQAAILRDPGNTAEAWIGDGEDGQQAGFLRSTAHPDRAVRIDDVDTWAQICDSMGLAEGADAQTAPAPAAGVAGAGAAPSKPHVAAKPTPPAQPATQGKAAATPDEVLTPTDDAEQNGIMIALMVPEGDARDMVLDLDTAEPWTDLHLTLAYLGTTDEVDDEGEFYANVLEALREVASDREPLTGEVCGVGRFSTGGNEDALIYLFDSPDLPELRQSVVDALEEQGVDVNRDHGFTPHITLAYLKEGEDTPIRRAEVKVLSFEGLTFAYGDQRLNIKFGAASPDEAEDDAYLYESGTRYNQPDSTAPAATPNALKALPPQFRRGKNGKNKVGKRGGPPIAAGAFVSWGNQRGKVDLIVTNGKVPGVEEDITGTADKPAARVVVYTPGAGGKLKSTGKKVGVSVSSLKRSAPFAFGKKDLDLADPEAALIEVLTDYFAASWESKDLPLVDPVAVREVYERGLETWPEESGIGNQTWALGRTKAFLTVAAGGDIPGYEADRDLLPGGHPLAVKATPMVTVVATPLEAAATADPPVEQENKAATAVLDEGETVLDRASLDDILAGIRAVLD